MRACGVGAETEHAGVVGARGVRIDERAHARLDAVGADEDIGGGGGAVGEPGGHAVAMFLDADQALGVFDRHAGVDGMIAQDLMQGAAIDRVQRFQAGGRRQLDIFVAQRHHGASDRQSDGPHGIAGADGVRAARPLGAKPRALPML